MGADSRDQLVVALKTVEGNGAPKESFITVFSVADEVLLEETLPGRHKFEGVKFFDWKTSFAIHTQQ